MSELLDAATALGTVAAAAAAAVGLRAANRTARVAERQLAAQWQPLLVDVPNDPSRVQSRSIRLPSGRRVEVPGQAGEVAVGDAIVQVTGDAGEYAVVSFRNIGGGAATILDAALFIDNSQVRSSWRVEHPLLGAHERSRVVVALAADDPQRGRFIDCARQVGAGISVGIDYTDLSGASRGEVIFDLARELERGWFVQAVHQHVLPVPLRRLTDVASS